VFYSNPVTGTCAWQIPPTDTFEERPELTQWWELFDTNYNRPYYYNTSSCEVSWTKPIGVQPVKLPYGFGAEDAQDESAAAAAAATTTTQDPQPTQSTTVDSNAQAVDQASEGEEQGSADDGDEYQEEEPEQESDHDDDNNYDDAEAQQASDNDEDDEDDDEDDQPLALVSTTAAAATTTTTSTFPAPLSLDVRDPAKLRSATMSAALPQPLTVHVTPQRQGSFPAPLSGNTAAATTTTTSTSSTSTTTTADADSSEEASEQPLPYGWKEYLDPTTKEVYYVNKELVCRHRRILAHCN
jgi:hypothetical protein